MGTFNLISSSSMDRYNKAERLNLLTNFMALMPGANPAGGDGEESGGEGGSPLTNTQAPAATGVPALSISQEQIDRMNELIGQMSEQTMQATSSAETPEMQQLEADRDVAANYIVRRIADYNRLPLAAEREGDRLRFTPTSNAPGAVPNRARRAGEPEDGGETVGLDVSYPRAKYENEDRRNPTGKRASSGSRSAEDVRQEPIGEAARRHRSRNAETFCVAQRPELARPKPAENEKRQESQQRIARQLAGFFAGHLGGSGALIDHDAGK